MTPLSSDAAAAARQRANLRPGPPAAHGNGQAVKHGAHSEIRLAPLREEHARDLRERYPGLDDLRRAMLADRLARISLASRWLDAKGTIMRGKRGEVFDVVDRVERWASRVEQIVGELEREQQGERVPLAVALSEPNATIRAALLRQLGFNVPTLPEEAEAR